MTDTPEMVAKVARALCWKNGMNPDVTLGGDGVNFLWHEYEDQARAAILAMREPTPEMRFAGAAYLHSRGYTGVTASDLWPTHHAMIDAALKGPANG